MVWLRVPETRPAHLVHEERPPPWAPLADRPFVIFVGLIRARQRQHMFRITYRDQNDVDQVVIFETPKQLASTLQAVLETRGPTPPQKRCSRAAARRNKTGVQG